MSNEQSSATFRLSLRDVLAAVPAVSAATVAALYALGVMLNVTQLLGAEVPVLDALPLIPLQDHLTKGLGAVFTSVVLFTFALLLFTGVLAAYASARSLEHHGQMLAAIDANVAAVTALGESLETDASERKAVIAAEHDALSADLDSLVAESKATGESLESFDRRMERLRGRLEEIREHGESIQAEQATVVARVQAQANEHIRQANQAVSVVQLRTRVMGMLERRLAGFGRIFGVAVIVAALFAPPVFAAGVFVVGLFLVLGGLRRFLTQPIVASAVVVLALALPYAVDAYVHPLPLSRATITTDTGVVRGSLVTSNGDRYVITAQPNAFRSIPVARVRSATVVRPRRPTHKRVVQLLFE